MQFVKRAEWGARPPRAKTPSAAKKVAIHFIGPSSPGEKPHSGCGTLMKQIQDQHMDTDQLAPGGANDIAYNLGVCQHGFVFEGRGKGVQSAANGTTAANQSHLAIVYLGGTGDPFTAEAKDALAEAAEFLGVTDPAWKRHRDFVSTECPGDEIAAWVNAGHPRASVRKEDEMTPKDRETLNFIAQVLKEMKTFYGKFDPQGQDDFFRGMDEAAKLIKAAAEA